MERYSDLYGCGEEEALSRKGRLAADFKAQFGCAPTRFFSTPGRAEIVGNNTDQIGRAHV